MRFRLKKLYSIVNLARKNADFQAICLGLSGAKEYKSCRSRKMLENAPTLAIVAVHTEENEPPKVWKQIRVLSDFATSRERLQVHNGGFPCITSTRSSPPSALVTFLRYMLQQLVGSVAYLIWPRCLFKDYAVAMLTYVVHFLRCCVCTISEL